MALYIKTRKPDGRGDDKSRIAELENIVGQLIDEINFSITHLGAENVLEASKALSVDAHNINVGTGGIASEQIECVLGTKIVDEDGNPLITFGSDGTARFNGYAAY